MKYHFMFWIKSSRGTDECCVRVYGKKPTKEQLKADAEEWCEKFGAWHVSDNYVTYGFKLVVKPKKSRSTLKKLLKQRSRLDDRIKVLRAWEHVCPVETW